MGARDLGEPSRAQEKLLRDLVTGQRRSQNRQQWTGAIQRTTTEGSGAATTNGSQVTLSSIDLEPGTWAVFGRAGVQISSTNGVPTFSGREAFTIKMNVLRRDSTDILEELDAEVWAPAVDSEVWATGFYSASAMLFGSMTYDAQTTVVVVGSTLDSGSAAHIIPWRAGKLMALPF